jgi:hypothetical protein
VVSQAGSLTFPVAGTWYDYLNGSTITAAATAQNFTLQPGEYHVYLNRNLVNAVTTPVIDINNPPAVIQVSVYPNPVTAASTLAIYLPHATNVQVDLWNAQGQKLVNILNGNMANGKHTMALSAKTNNLPAGIYLMKIQAENSVQSIKLLIP